MRTGSLLSCPLILLALGMGPAQAAPWIPCAQLSGLNPVTCEIPGRPSTAWEYAIAFNSREPHTVVCTFWNVGTGARIANKQPYLVFSDNPATGAQWGGFVFYQNTPSADDDACAGGYRHRYWTLGADNEIIPDFSLGCVFDLQVYCRRR